MRTSNIRDHAQSDQHVHAMSLQHAQLGKADSYSVSQSPIVVALSTLPEDEKVRPRHKFDIAYFVATEKMSFRKYPHICELEARHGVDIGIRYTTETAAKSFIHYIAESRRQGLVETLHKANFFSLLLDGSTDVGNVDNELLLVVWFDREVVDENVCTKTSYFKMSRPSTVTAEGLFEVLESALQTLGIPAITGESCAKLVGIGTDGASTNMAARGLKGLVEDKVSWVFWMWCLAHRVELALKDALKQTAFEQIEEMLLRLYLLYEKSPKKCRQLEEIITDLRGCLSFDDGGTKPIRASGSRWVGHKFNAMKRILSKYGAYTNHLAALSEDPTVKSADQAKLRGYYTKWVNGKYLLGCAVFTDLLAPCAILSKVLQYDQLNIIVALNSILRTVKETEKLSSTPLEQWATFAATLKKCTSENGNTIYQCQELKSFASAKAYYETHCAEYCTKVTQCIRRRLAWSDLQLLRDIIFTLSSQGWEKAVDEGDKLEAIDRLSERFRTPLEAAGAQIDEIHAEYEGILQYAIQYISLSTLDYRAVWWRLFHAPAASEWASALTLAELLLSLPASNGKLERVFSQVNVIKSNKRSLLSNEAIDDLLMVTTDGVPLKDFNSDHAIDLWWKDKVRRPSQKPRKQYAKRSGTETGEGSQERDRHSADSEDAPNMLDDWDAWMNSDSDVED